MKYGVIILSGALTFLLSCEKEISEAQSEKFVKFYGSYTIDTASDVEVLSNGGYAICGTSVTQDDGSQMILVVTDEFGNLRQGFPRYYSDGERSAGANALVLKNGGQGGFLVCGYSMEPGTAGDEDIYMVRVNTDGDTLWTRTFGSSEDEAILHAAEGLSSGFMLAGYQEKNGEKDILIMQVGEQGDSIPLSLLYTKPFNSSDMSANYILNTGENYLCVCTYNRIIGEGNDILVLNFNDELAPNFRILSLGGNFNEYGNCIVEDTAGKYLVLGNRINAQTKKSEILIYSLETEGLRITGSDFLATIAEINTDLVAERLVKTTDGRFAVIGTRKTGGDSDIFLQFIQDYQVAERLIYGSTGEQTGADIGLPLAGGLVLLGDNGYERNSMISLIRTDAKGNL